jgi:hypothetical protein
MHLGDHQQCKLQIAERGLKHQRAPSRRWVYAVVPLTSDAGNALLGILSCLLCGLLGILSCLLGGLLVVLCCLECALLGVLRSLGSILPHACEEAARLSSLTSLDNLTSLSSQSDTFLCARRSLLSLCSRVFGSLRASRQLGKRHNAAVLSVSASSPPRPHAPSLPPKPPSHRSFFLASSPKIDPVPCTGASGEK